MDIELSEAVAAVREELLTAATYAAGQDVAFAVGPIEMEFAVELRSDAKAKAGFRAWVISADGEAGVTRGRSQKVKITLTPKRPDGSDLLISGTTDDRSHPVPMDRIGR